HSTLMLNQLIPLFVHTPPTTQISTLSLHDALPIYLKAIDALTHCRTRALGASYYRCKLNHAEIEQLHSCRHRSCYVCTHKQRLEDRKSTRLNSSHVKISYAVFCLKKKTKAKHNEL